MTIVESLLVLLAALLGGGLVFVLLRLRAGGPRSDPLAEAVAQLAGRLDQMAQAQAAQQAEVGRLLNEGLDRTAQSTRASLADLQARLAVIDAAQARIGDLSKQVVGLQDILSNKQARGAFGEVQLENLVRQILPPSAYAFQVQIGSGRRVDCLLQLPNPPGPIAIDAKFPLEAWYALRDAGDDAARIAARRLLAQAVLKHVQDIAQRYIVPGETAESALMFLPSEAVYAELHASLPEVVEKSWTYRVWIVSPTTLMATLNTVRAVLKDVQMREQAGLIQKEVALLLQDMGRLNERVGKLSQHFRQASDDIRQIEISTEKVIRHANHIGEVQLSPPPAPAPGVLPKG